MDSDMSDDASFAAPLSRSMSGASLSRHSSAASLASARSGSYSVVDRATQTLAWSWTQHCVVSRPQRGQK